jgi:hypothetical protein
MGGNTKEISKVAKKMARVLLYGQMVISISAVGEQTKCMDLEFTSTQRTRQRSKGSGSMERDMSGLHE